MALVKKLGSRAARCPAEAYPVGLANRRITRISPQAGAYHVPLMYFLLAETPFLRAVWLSFQCYCAQGTPDFSRSVRRRHGHVGR